MDYEDKYYNKKNIELWIDNSNNDNEQTNTPKNIIDYLLKILCIYYK